MMTTGPGHDVPVRPPGGTRASDADRERAADVIKAAFAEGRLTRDEHGTRVERAYGARTYAELATITADLPSGPFVTLPPGQQAALAAHLPAAPQRTNPLAVAALACGLLPGIPQLAAIVLAIEAHRQIRRTGERGALLATAGLALSVLGLVAGLLFVFVF